MKKIFTQLQPTTILYGKDAEAVYKEVLRKPTQKQKEQLRNKYSQLFEQVCIKSQGAF